jgi:hypothetical protein
MLGAARIAGGAAPLAAGLLASISFAWAYEAGPVSDGARVEGQVLYTGRIPTKHIIPNDPEVCGPPRDIPLIHTAADGAVTDAVVFLEGIERGKPWPPLAKTPELDNKDCEFAPRIVVMPPGTIAVVNSDPVLHNTHSFYGPRTAFNLALPKQGLVIEKELKRPGILNVQCDAHGHMSARIFVAANPYYASTENGGTFELPELPAGDYRIVAYQEQTGRVEAPLAVKPGETIRLRIDLAKKAIERH